MTKTRWTGPASQMANSKKSLDRFSVVNIKLKDSTREKKYFKRLPERLQRHATTWENVPSYKPTWKNLLNKEVSYSEA